MDRIKPGTMTAYWNCCGLWAQMSAPNAYFEKKLVMINGNCAVTDKLGSVRAVASAQSCTSWVAQPSYFPYGEEQTLTANGIEKFATYFRDANGQDYARQRYYNSNTGRFWSPDPGGIRTAVPSRPSSWNRYAYTEGDPVNHTDRRGLDEDCNDDPDTCDDNPCSDYSDGLDLLGEFDPGCLTGDPGSSAPPTAAPSPEPTQCDVTLMSTGPHTLLTLGTYNPNTGASSTTTVEAGPLPKDGKNFSLFNIASGGAWLNPLNYGMSAGKQVYNFEAEYNNQQLCIDVADLQTEEAEYKPDTVTYNLLGPNSNTFTAYMLQQAGMSLPASVSLALAFSAPGWFSAMPPNP